MRCLDPRTVDDVELATLGWVHWWNTDRIHGYLDDLSPDQFEGELYTWVDGGSGRLQAAFLRHAYLLVI